MLSWRIRIPRTDPISDILGVDKGNLVSSAISAIEEPPKDPKKHPQTLGNCFPFYYSGPQSLVPPPGPLIDKAQRGPPIESGRAVPHIQRVLASAH